MYAKYLNRRAQRNDSMKSKNQNITLVWGQHGGIWYRSVPNRSMDVLQSDTDLYNMMLMLLFQKIQFIYIAAYLVP